MAPPPRPQSEPLAASALEFLLFLGKAEAAACGDVPFSDARAPGVIAVDEDPDVVRARIHAYGSELSARLADWEGLPEAASERYRSRVEDLAPTLERWLERRAAAAAAEAAAAAGVTPGKRARAGGEAQTAAQVPTEDSSEPHSYETADRAVLAGDDSAECTSNEAPSMARSLPPKGDVELPWRRPSTRAQRTSKHSGAAATCARGQLESEILEVTEGMKDAASSFLATLKRDNQTLSKISEMQDSSINKVTKETQKGKQVLRSSQIGFLCTMAMLVSSIVIFFMLCLLILIT